MNRRDVLKSSVLGILPAVVGMNLPANTQESESEIKKENPFFEYFKNKHGFELYPYQKRYIDFLENSPEKLIIVRKPRQIGFSTLHYTWAEYRRDNFKETTSISGMQKYKTIEYSYLNDSYSGRDVLRKYCPNNYIMDEFALEKIIRSRQSAVYLNKILNGEEIKFNKLILFSTPSRINYKLANKNGYITNYSAKVFKDLYYKFPNSVFNITHEDLKVCDSWNRVVKLAQFQKQQYYGRGLYEMEVLGIFPTEFI